MNSQDVQEKVRLFANSVFTWSDAHRKATAIIIAFVVGFITARIL